MILLTHEDRWRGGETVVALGTFDGVHLGHAALLRTAKELAQREGLSSLVYTFSTHPAAVFSPEHVPPCLQTRSEKIREIAAQGVDAALLRPFDAAYAARTPEAFAQMLAATLSPRHVVVGFNYSFGHRGAGKPEDLSRLGEALGFKTHIVEAVTVDGEAVSSTRVRAAVEAGEMELAARMLGRPYAVCGVVVRGKALGRTLDFPTANLPLPRGKALPPNGVYAARVYVRGGWYAAAVNIGSHPTAPGGGADIEAHLLDYDAGECYGDHMRVLLYHRVREERRFDSLDALREEVLRNREQVRAYFTDRNE